MWSIKELKKSAKKTLKNNFWTLIFLGILMSIAFGRYTINTDSFSKLESAYEYSKSEEFLHSNNKEKIIQEYLDDSISQTLTGNDNLSKLIKNYNEEHNITKGVVYSIVDLFTKGQLQIQNIINSVEKFINKENLGGIVIIIASSIGLLIRIFIAYPIRVGESRVYLESINYKKTRIRRMLFAFKKERYNGTVKTLLLMEIYKLLWNLTIVGGFIKNYSYKMVTYIIAENPKISAKDAIKISREMMNGNKFQAFKLDLSFIGWNILQYITFGIAGIFVSPYYTTTITQLYFLLRKDYIENKKYKYEVLNDEKLYEENELEKYPDKYEIERKKIKIDYNKKYELTSIILFFFIFSFAGWIWEVSLYLFRDGILVNRGTLYGPWLPIYGTGCTIIILLTHFKKFRKILKNPFATFLIITAICSVIEYLSSWYIEKNTGLRYWDYTGVFGNINGRICFECSVFFGLGGSLCIYIIAPYLERKIQRITYKTKIIICAILVVLFGMDNIYSNINKREGEGITVTNQFDKNAKM